MWKHTKKAPLTLIRSCGVCYISISNISIGALGDFVAFGVPMGPGSPEAPGPQGPGSPEARVLGQWVPWPMGPQRPGSMAPWVPRGPPWDPMGGPRVPMGGSQGSHGGVPGIPWGGPRDPRGVFSHTYRDVFPWLSGCFPILFLMFFKTFFSTFF